jgi:hypothetical protein
VSRHRRGEYPTDEASLASVRQFEIVEDDHQIGRLDRTITDGLLRRPFDQLARGLRRRLHVSLVERRGREPLRERV